MAGGTGGHVFPALGLATDNQAIGSAVGKGTSGEAISVLGTVLFTGLAGVVFCELRRRSGSLLASIGLHWATNGLGVLAAASIWAATDRRPSSEPSNHGVRSIVGTPAAFNGV